MNEREYLLASLAEECAEISEQCCRLSVRVFKALRFGVDEVQSGQVLSNVERIAAEIADLMALAEMLEDLGVITRSQVNAKKEKAGVFMRYAAECGSLRSSD